ncbi:DUF397 domain-containing protein [Streptomyces sp. NPDC001980]|uniref:DUF397 domain-containing protein n=1 Tax=Streptomyces sp. NPDC001980 TaxID=3157126 RepID=UPI00332D0CC6
MSSRKLNWFKSSYSDGGGGECLEAAYTWRKSSYSSGGGGECLEVRTAPSVIHIRDSKRTAGPAAPHLTLSPSSWTAFLTGVTGPGTPRPS